ncbi:MAG: ABC transporter permease [Proteobacteria bacterium]|nr:ABC transporter permease [Pseudomonadota bacterium]
MLWIRLGIRELMENKGFAFFFTVNLALGLAGFIAIHSFGSSLDRHLDENLKEILTADLVLSANSPLTPSELALADGIMGTDTTAHARLVRFYTMVRTADNARLVMVMAIDNAYPLYGSFLLEGGGPQTDIQKNPGLFMTRDTAHALGIGDTASVNTSLVLGNKHFYVQDFFKKDPDRSLTAVELAPKIYMGMGQLEETGLIRFGSRIRYLYYYRFSPGTDISKLVERLGRGFSHNSQGQPRVSVYGSRDVNNRLGKITGYFTGYLGLTSIVALFLAGIATAYLFRGYLNMKQREMAVLMGIGAKQSEIYLYVSVQLIALGALASFLAVLLSFLLVPAFPVIFKGLIPADIRLSTDPATLVLAVGMGMVGSFFFCLPVFVRIFGVKPLHLLKGDAGPGNLRMAFWQGIGFLPGIGAFFLVCMAVAGSMVNGSIFALGFLLAMLFLAGMGWCVFSGCKFFFSTRHLTAKIAFRNLYRNKWSSLSCFVTIAMGTFLISIIPQVQKGLQTEIMRPEGLKIPVFFLVDIQEEQKKPFMAFIGQEDADLTNISPMVRGRILLKNKQAFYGEKAEKGSGVRPRGRRLEFNFSHRSLLDVSETIVQGKALSQTPWDFEAGLPFEISVAKSFAQEHGLSLGDILGIDIQGIFLEGRVVNIRKVRWNSFQPNFYLLFQDGVLNDAPKTYLAAISRVAPEDRQNLKNKIVNAFPNISIIDVTQMAKTLLDISDRLSLSIRFMAWLAIAAGLVSIFSIVRHEARKNERQVTLLKVLGADFDMIRGITLLEFGFIGFTASLVALVLSFGCSRAIAWYFFDSLWQFDLLACLVILILTTGVCMGTALTGSWKVMNTKPVTLLKNT